MLDDVISSISHWDGKLGLWGEFIWDLKVMEMVDSSSFMYDDVGGYDIDSNECIVSLLSHNDGFHIKWYHVSIYSYIGGVVSIYSCIGSAPWIPL